jgi:hypothetical protein
MTNATQAFLRMPPKPNNSLMKPTGFLVHEKSLQFQGVSNDIKQNPI